MGFPDDPQTPPPPAPPPPSAEDVCAYHSVKRTHVYCVACNSPICEQCTTPLGGGEQAGHPVCPTCAPVAPVESSVPWEGREGKGWGTFKRTFFMPFHKQGELFRAFPCRPLGAALGFAVLAAIPGAILTSLSTMAQNAIGLGPLSQIQNPDQMRNMPPEARAQMEEFIAEWGTLIEAGLTALPIIMLVFVPLAILFSGLIYHLGAWMMGAKHDLVTTLRIVCYLQPLTVIYAVPLFGPLAGFVFMVIGVLTAMQRVNGLSSGRAAIVAFMPLILGLLLGCCTCAGFIMIIVAAAN